MSTTYVLGLVAAIAAIAILVLVFFWEIVSVIVNVALLYLVVMRAYVKWKQNDYFHYIIGIAAGALIVLFLGNFFPFWRITNVAVISAIIAELIYWIPKVSRAQRSKRKRHC